MTRDITMFHWSDSPSRTGKRASFLLFFILVFGQLGGCSSAADESIRLGLASAPITLDPRFATDATSSRVCRLLYTRLVEFDDQQRPVPGIASWEQLSPKHYRFQLEKNSESRRFHNGEYLTAYDVKASYDSVLNPVLASPHRATLDIIERIEVLDEDTLDFFLDRGDILFPGYLVIGIMPSSLLHSQHPFRTHPVGSGGFRFNDWPEEGRLLLTRVSDSQAISIIHVADATVRTLKLLRGEIDILQNDLSPELVKFLGDRKDVDVIRSDGSNFTYLGFNLQDSETGDPRVREAIAFAIDRDAIIRYVMGHSARPASAILSPGHWAGNPGLKILPYDPERSRQLLKEAGYTDDKPLILNYKTSTNAFRVRLATVLQSQLGNVGIQVNLNSYDWGTLYGDIKAGNFQMYSMSWVGIKSPDIFRYVFYSSAVPPKGANRGRYKNQQVDYLIDAAAEAPELSQQADLYQQVQAILLADLPYVPLWYEDHVVALNSGVKAYHVGQDGNFDGLLTVTKP